MKKIIKNKKSQTALINSFIFDLLFAAVLLIALFGMLKTVNSGMYYWRRFYATDISTLFTITEATSDDFEMAYVPHERKKRLPLESTFLELEITPGLVEVYSSNDPSYKSREQFVTKKGSDLSLNTQLRNLFIRKVDNITSVSSDSSCISYSIDKKYFVNTSIYTRTTFNPNNFISNPEFIKDSFESRLSAKYRDLYPEEDSTDRRASCLINKNINNEDKVDIYFDLHFEKSDENKIVISYPKSGSDKKVSATIACKFFNEIRHNSNLKDEIPNLRIIYNPNSDINVPSEVGSGTGLVKISFYLPEYSFNQDLSGYTVDSMFNVLKGILNMNPLDDLECP